MISTAETPPVSRGPIRMRCPRLFFSLVFSSLALFWSPPSFADDRHDPHALGYTGYDDSIQSSVRKYWGAFSDWTWWKAQIYQESAFDTYAVSGVGARGLCQAMPATFADWARQLRWGDASPHVAKYCIDGGAFYMAQLRNFPDWRSWPEPDRHRMAQAAYNAGAGTMRKAIQACSADSWSRAAGCLPQITGKANAHQTTDYVAKIARWRRELSALPPIITLPCLWTGHRGGCGPIGARP